MIEYMNEVTYSNLIDILISWGKVHMTQPEFTKILEEYEDAFKYLLETEEEILQQINEGKNELYQQLERSKNLLQNIGIVNATPYDQLFRQVADAFETLDHLVFLNHALHRLAMRNYGQRCKGVKLFELTNETDKKIDELSNWFYGDSNISALRFTPFNSIRQKRYNFIQQAYRFLFPWYGLFVEESDGILEVFQENFHIVSAAIERDNTKQFTKTFGENANIYLFELKSDSELYKIIKENYQMEQAVYKAIQRSPALQLFRISELIRLEYYLPNEFWEYPLINILKEYTGKMYTLTERVGWAFLMAFLGPCPPAKTIDILSWVDENLKEIKLNECSEEKIIPVLNVLLEWKEGKISDIEMEQKIFNYWKDLLKSLIVSRERTREDITAEEFWPALENLIEEPFWPPIQLPKAPLYISAQPTMELGEEGRQIGRLELHSNHLLVKISPIRGELRFLHALEEHAHSDWESVRTFLSTIRQFYWICWAQKKDGKVKKFSIKSEKRGKTFYIQNEEYKKVIVVISTKEELLRKISNNEPLEEDEKQEVLYLEYEVQ